MLPEPVPSAAPELPSQPKLLDQLRDRLRVKHYSIRTEQAYVDWVRRFILFHGKRHPRDLGPQEVEAFLTHLAVRGRVSASTQNQAKSAILFLFREVIDRELPWLDGIVAARMSQRLPVVLSLEEVEAALGRMRGTSGLVARLLYGSGLRILECLRLRVKDIDFTRHEILVRDGKGAKDRVTMLPQSLVKPLRGHLQRVRELHAEDLTAGSGSVYLPYALERKYTNASKEWMWQYVFPSTRLSRDPRSDAVRRHHADEKPIQRALQLALRAAGIHKPATPHTLRHYAASGTMPSKTACALGGASRLTVCTRHRFFYTTRP
jgi:integron integrase